VPSDNIGSVAARLQAKNANSGTHPHPAAGANDELINVGGFMIHTGGIIPDETPIMERLGLSAGGEAV
jgi:hypothetical protein